MYHHLYPVRVNSNEPVNHLDRKMPFGEVCLETLETIKSHLKIKMAEHSLHPSTLHPVCLI